VDNIKLDLVEIKFGGVSWICLPQDRHKWMAFINVVMNLRIPENPGKQWSGCTSGGLSNSAELHRVSYEY
jgi:hypothetical protein